MQAVIGILVCQSEEVLEHKKKDGKKSDGRYCFWEMTRFPKKIKELLYPESTGIYSVPAKAPGYEGIYDEDDLVFEGFEVRLYFAVKGIVQGYFVCKACNKTSARRSIRQRKGYGLSQLRFFSESWIPFKKKIKIKPSQGWRYFNHEEMKE